MDEGKARPRLHIELPQKIRKQDNIFDQIMNRTQNSEQILAKLNISLVIIRSVSVLNSIMYFEIVSAVLFTRYNYSSSS